MTFNYDTLLEEALSADSRFGIRIREMDDYVNGRYKVIKPHGSVNWSHRVSSCPFDFVRKNEDDLIPLLIENVAELKIDTTINLEEILRVVTPEPKYPALAIPVEAKSEYECPIGHMEKLWQFLPKVKIVVMVGWRAMEKSFMNKLAQGLSSDVRVQVVSSGQNGAEGTKKHLQQEGIHGEIYAASAAGFTEFAKNVEARRFLNQMSAQMGLEE